MIVTLRIERSGLVLQAENSINAGTARSWNGSIRMTQSCHRTVILVVEDEPFIRMDAVDLLAEEGRIILEAGCAQEALAVIEAEGRIDLLFTDINMPGELDGLDLAAIAHRRQPDLKLIVTSGAKKLADEEIPDHGVFIPKPYSTRDLARLVALKLAATL